MSENPQNSCFVDSNVWLYAMIKTSAPDSRQAKAKSLLSSLEDVIVISTQIVNEVCVNLIKKSLLDEQQIEDLIKSFYKKYRVIEINLPILLKASQLRKQYSFSFWDSLIVASALHADTKIIYSEDMQDGLKVLDKVEIVNPFN
ncbi:twitching motility protein PilT [[Phormidium ambiguum] IAM M-71]|uniref:Twitching motility protein PilT n=1 Tax=[Phormidium ambiguum] IAM M-71 TaxID=454136 RepID=A0A1U7I7E2_9CYAN|nr:PIN domain-containing protein [Phormidium ambiguum]OKH32274.1 twitching motility protein PilT [Phormidium ambiguum IAM M-71]